ncbi:rhamnogalacturonan acetylesterase [Paenibacillus sp. y28]|uniref:rhamnogalacturonan acetylesterase n=1 Tax=Paenibacillus sp. y28 TaxID=3129110 RepID=UPI0030176AAE
MSSVTVYLAGDSTVSSYGPEQSPRAGWGQMLGRFFDETVRIANAASSGRSSKSFIDEGRLDAILRSIQAGDYLFIQFGHNDQKPDAERHTEANGSYRAYLQQYIDGARQAGAYPVLVTSVNRRSFDGRGRFVPTHDDYPEAMLQLGREQNVPVLDLCSRSEALYRMLGPEASKTLLLWLAPGEHANYPEGEKDNTHFNETGAVQIAGLVVELLKEAELPLVNHLKAYEPYVLGWSKEIVEN